LDSNFHSAYHNRGRAHAEKQEYDQAIIDYNEAIRLKPNFAVAYINRGNAYQSQGKFNKAKADFAKADELEKAGK
jgi:tetratricopeptide (TPR) repeat protein